MGALIALVELHQFLTDLLEQGGLLEELGRDGPCLVLVLRLAGFAALDLDHLADEGLLAVEGSKRLGVLVGCELGVGVGLGQPVDECVQHLLALRYLLGRLQPDLMRSVGLARAQVALEPLDYLVDVDREEALHLVGEGTLVWAQVR